MRLLCRPAFKIARAIIARKCLLAGYFGDGIEAVFGFPAVSINAARAPVGSSLQQARGGHHYHGHFGGATTRRLVPAPATSSIGNNLNTLA
jgi:hypothetical protein